MKPYKCKVHGECEYRATQTKAGLLRQCRACVRRREREYAARNKAKRKVRFSQWLEANREERKKYHISYKHKVRIETLQAYGAKCACCGETHVEFLCIDHTNGDGGKHRKEMGGRSKAAYTTYKWLKERGYPQAAEGYAFRVLCYNCNLSRAHAGYCPHERNEQSV